MAPEPSASAATHLREPPPTAAAPGGTPRAPACSIAAMSVPTPSTKKNPSSTKLHCSHNNAPSQLRPRSIAAPMKLHWNRGGAPMTPDALHCSAAGASMQSRRSFNGPSRGAPSQHPPSPGVRQSSADIGPTVVHRCSIAAPDAADDVSLQPAPAWHGGLHCSTLTAPATELHCSAHRLLVLHRSATATRLPR